MKKILKVFLIVGAIFILCIFAFIVSRILYYLVDISYFWLHEYQTIEVMNYEKRVRIYNNNLDDTTSFYLTIEEKQKVLIKEKYIWTGGIPSFSVIPSSSYKVIGITIHGYRPNEIVVLFDFETNEFWAADNDKHNDQELGRKLLTKLLSYPQEPFILYGSEQ